ncbi:hypothetical protein BDV97DRAFT_71925 [Delphinella strobiligena]|nr:hypothetical protein BDV97DRAFT_71925 [Delphinella strobiligena]
MTVYVDNNPLTKLDTAKRGQKRTQSQRQDLETWRHLCKDDKKKLLRRIERRTFALQVQRSTTELQEPRWRWRCPVLITNNGWGGRHGMPHMLRYRSALCIYSHIELLLREKRHRYFLSIFIIFLTVSSISRLDESDYPTPVDFSRGKGCRPTILATLSPLSLPPYLHRE